MQFMVLRSIQSQSLNSIDKRKIFLGTRYNEAKQSRHQHFVQQFVQQSFSLLIIVNWTFAWWLCHLEPAKTNRFKQTYLILIKNNHLFLLSSDVARKGSEGWLQPGRGNPFPALFQCLLQLQ